MSEADFERPPGASAPLYILSFRQRDELAALAATGGWQVVAARRADDAERRFLASGAAVAVVDARGALEDGLTAAQALGATIAANGAAMLVLVSRGDVGAVSEFHDAGATQFLASPHSEPEFVQALRFAARHAERMAGDWRGSQPPAVPMGWHYDPAGNTLHLTPAFADLLDLPDLTSPRSLLGRLDRADRRAAITALRRLRATGAPTAFAHDLDGTGRLVEHLQRDRESGRIDALVEPLGHIPDTAAVVRDALTGARDAASARRWLDRRLAERGKPPLHAVLIALTRFDMVNTAYGRAAGDALLRSAMKRIDDVAGELLGRGSIVSRMGGSEFLLAATEGAERIALAAERVAEALARPFVTGDAMTALGCRIGIAAARPDDQAATLLRRASEALAEAKASDSVTIRTADDESDQGMPIEKLAVDLRHAMDRDEIDILFQPQVSISTGAIVGVEALARWEHGRLGSLGADTLFAAAERADLSIALSDRIQQCALDRAARWSRPLGGLRLSVNLTAADIARPGFADIFLDRIDSSGFPRNRLTVEITESGLIDDLGAAATLLATLRSAGCRVAIDDFGTGYSSLAYLKSLPLDYLKIDKKLAQDIAGTARDRVVVRGVIEMARSLGLAVIAEGVETAEQLDLLAKEGCNYYQGFLCAEAIDSAALAALIEKGAT